MAGIEVEPGLEGVPAQGGAGRLHRVVPGAAPQHSRRGPFQDIAVEIVKINQD